MSRAIDIMRRAGFLAVMALSALLMGVGASPLAAQEIGDVAAGRRMAEAWCSRCHALTATERSRMAPSFAAVARMPSTTPMSLRVFLRSMHAGMPNLNLTDTEIDDLTALILSLHGS